MKLLKECFFSHFHYFIFSKKNLLAISRPFFVGLSVTRPQRNGERGGGGGGRVESRIRVGERGRGRGGTGKNMPSPYFSLSSPLGGLGCLSREKRAGRRRRSKRGMMARNVRRRGFEFGKWREGGGGGGKAASSHFERNVYAKRRLSSQFHILSLSATERLVCRQTCRCAKCKCYFSLLLRQVDF